MKKPNSLSSLLSVISSSSSEISINPSINKLSLSSTEIINTNSNSKEEKKCTNQEVIEGGCTDLITKEQIKEIYQYLKENIIKNNSNIIIESKNVIFQVSSLESQKDNKANISSIDLGNCEQALKNKENLTDNDELIIFKIDIKNNDSSLTYVQYEIYNSVNMKQLSLDVCKNITIKMTVPVILEQTQLSLISNVEESGYNVFDITDDFYNDVCSVYTAENGADMVLSSRKTRIY